MPPLRRRPFECIDHVICVRVGGTHTRENVVQRLTQLFSTSDISTTDTNIPAETLLTRAQ